MATHSEHRRALLEFVRSQRGVDFTCYKQPTVERRLEKRLQATGATGYAEYLELLRASPAEVDRLLETVFINVTAFFRDPDAWVSLRRQVEEFFDAESAAPIRVWCAGVASGEEAYSVAMVLADHLGAAPFRSRVTVYATDVDDEEVALARCGLYTATQIEHVPAGLREAYLEPAGDRFTLRSDLRQSLIFGRHDLLQDTPISRVDLLICRNTLMYFNRETQDRTLARFHSALNDPGLLFLGRAEVPLNREYLFEQVDGSARIFRKVERVSLWERTAITRESADGHDGTARRLYEELNRASGRSSPVPSEDGAHG